MSSADLCALSQEITLTIYPIFICLVIVNTVSFVGNIIVLYIFVTHAIYHIHLRICIVNLIMAMLVRTAFTTTRAILRIIVVLKAESSCDYMEDLHFCSSLSILGTSILPTVSASYALFAIERIIGYHFIHNYEKKQFVPLVLLVNLATWSVFIKNLYFKIGDLFPSDTKSIEHVPYCSSTSTKQVTVFSVIEYNLPVVLLATVLLSVLRIVVRNKSRLSLVSRPHLSSRFELKCSTSALRIMLPNAWMAVSANFLSQTAVIIFLMSTYKSKVEYAVIKELMSATVIPLQYLIFPIVVLFCSNEVRRKRGKKAKVGISISTVDANNIVFSMWEEHSVKKERK